MPLNGNNHWYASPLEPVALTGDERQVAVDASKRIGERWLGDLLATAEIGVQNCHATARSKHVEGRPPQIPTVTDRLKYVRLAVGHKITQFLSAEERTAHEDRLRAMYAA